jgi:hypothetical protein
MYTAPCTPGGGGSLWIAPLMPPAHMLVNIMREPSNCGKKGAFTVGALKVNHTGILEG